MVPPGDLAWLSGRATLVLLDASVIPSSVPSAVAEAREAGFGGVVLAPSHVPLVGELGDLTVATAVGHPTGRHHSLVKAAEARLAVEQGATEVWLTPDVGVSDPNTLLAEFVAVREAVPAPVTLAVILETGVRAVGEVTAVMQAARLAGADRVVTSTGWREIGGTPGSAPLPVTATGLGHLDEVIAALEAGADRVGVSSVDVLRRRPR